MSDPRTALVLAALRKHPELDPKAVLSVFKQEGLSGNIGDGGHAFGPAQLNNAGGVITGKFQGESPEQINEWAWTPQGIEYALQGVSKAAAGQHGAQAVESIVRNFERPRDPNGEVARALGQSGGGAASGAGPSPQSGAATPPAGNPGNSRLAFTQALLGAIGPDGTLNQPATLLQALQARPLEAAWGTPGGPKGKPGQGQAGLPPLAPSKFESVDGVQVDPSIVGQLQQIVSQFGVRPTSGYRSPSHNAAVGGAPQSDHLSGDAVDFGGSPSQLSALYAYAQKQRFPYVEPMSQAKDHVHISFARRN